MEPQYLRVWPFAGLLITVVLFYGYRWAAKSIHRFGRRQAIDVIKALAKEIEERARSTSLSPAFVLVLKRCLDLLPFIESTDQEHIEALERLYRRAYQFACAMPPLDFKTRPEDILVDSVLALVQLCWQVTQLNSSSGPCPTLDWKGIEERAALCRHNLGQLSSEPLPPYTGYPDE